MTSTLVGSDLRCAKRLRRVRQLRPGRPFRAFGKRRARLDRLLLAFGDHTEERAVADHRDHARNRLRLAVVERGERRAVLRRAHHPAMHHAGQAQVLHVHRLAGHLAGNVEALDRLTHDLVQADRLRTYRGARLAIEVGRGGKLRVRDALAVRCADHAVRDAERIRAHLEPRRGKLDQDRAHFGGRETQRGPGVLDRLTAGRHSLVRGAAGVAGNHIDPRERQIELFGGDLRERGDDALPQLHLAGEDGRAAVCVDADPGIQLAIAIEATGEPLLFLCGDRIEREREHDSAETLGEIAAIDGDGHHVLPISLAARSTARTIRLCVPQRQRFAASAWRTSFSVGFGLRSSSALALMIMPLTQ